LQSMEVITALIKHWFDDFYGTSDKISPVFELLKKLRYIKLIETE
jgi:hypothetical protein